MSRVVRSTILAVQCMEKEMREVFAFQVPSLSKYVDADAVKKVTKDGNFGGGSKSLALER